MNKSPYPRVSSSEETYTMNFPSGENAGLLLANSPAVSCFLIPPRLDSAAGLARVLPSRCQRNQVAIETIARAGMAIHNHRGVVRPGVGSKTVTAGISSPFGAEIETASAAVTSPTNL